MEDENNVDEKVLDGQEQIDDETELDQEDDETSLEDEDSDEESGEDTDKGTDESSGKDKKMDSVQKRINKIHYEKKVAEEKLEAERQLREDLERKLAETNVRVPPIPPIPDYLDPDRDAKMVARDKIITAHAEEAVKKEMAKKTELSNMRSMQERHVAKVSTAVEKSYINAKAVNLDKKEFDSNQAVLGTYLKGKSDLALYLLEDDNGPLNITYLAQNLTELDKVSKMTQTQAAVYIATKITPKALKLKPKTTNAPEPLAHPRGNKNVLRDDPRIKGATFM